MKFAICASSDDHPTKVLKRYPCLNRYNHELGEDPGSDYFRQACVEINSLEELIALIEETGEPVIVSVDNRPGYPKHEIEIYDAAREW